MPLQSRHLLSDGLEYFLRLVRSHHSVEKAEVLLRDLHKAIVHISRESKADIHAYVADVYILTVADVVEILTKYPEINCIIVISRWNHYTNLAKDEARHSSVGVFTLNQFRRALNCNEWRKFLDTGDSNAFEE